MINPTSPNHALQRTATAVCKCSPACSRPIRTTSLFHRPPPRPFGLPFGRPLTPFESARASAAAFPARPPTNLHYSLPPPRPAMHGPRQPPPSLNLGSLGVLAACSFNG